MNVSLSSPRARTRTDDRPLLWGLATVAIMVSLAIPPSPVLASADDQTVTTQRRRVAETTFKSVDATIAAQWDFPRLSPAPLVVLIPAGGRIDRNGWTPSLGEDPDAGMYSRLTDELVAAGFAVFRFDKPGAGRSGRGRYATERSTALEAYTRAVDHARVDPDHVFILGHSTGTDAVAGIYPRYESVLLPAGVILLDNGVGERESLRIKAPVLIVNAGKDPDDKFQYGRFVTEARAKEPGGSLETELVLIEDAQAGLLAPAAEEGGPAYGLHPKAVDAVIDWLRRHKTRPAPTTASDGKR